MTCGGSSTPEVQRLLAVLAAGKRVGEARTAFGEGAAAMAATARSLVTVERDPERAAQALERLGAFQNVELLVGEWQALLPPRGPFELLFHDAGDFKRVPYATGELVVGMLMPGGLLVIDDMTPCRAGADPIREWISGHSRLEATELSTTPSTSLLLAARRA